ncbi:MAG: hypothetical protein U5J63_03560 [Fodinibius sp.]|nr:hypothetical protein [Fodinibius sp.]
MSQILKYIGSGIFVLMMAAAILQPTTDNETVTSTLTPSSCMAKTLLQGHSGDNPHQLIAEFDNTDSTTAQAAMNSSCQTICPFVAVAYELVIPTLNITGRTTVSSANRYAFLFDDRTADPPRYFG